MPRLIQLLPLALATLSVPALLAQAYAAGQTPSDSSSAPIERHAPTPDQYAAQHHLQNGPRQNTQPQFYSATLAAGQVLATTSGTANAQPVTGVYLRVAPNSAVREVASDAQHTEFRVERGLANISVHHPADGMLLLVDLPNGQAQMLKNGFYTFNAATNTVRVLKGEADAFPNSGPGSAADDKPVKVKEDHAVVFTVAPAQGKLRSVEFYPFQARNDVIPQPYDSARASDGSRYGGYAPYNGFYGEPYPYYAWGGPWGPYWGAPYFGYPFGFGFGYGFYGGGFYGGGFRGRR